MEQREEPYRSLFERNSDAVFLLDSDGRFVAVNASAEKISGYTAQELKEITFREICLPEELDAAVEEFQLALKGESHDLETAIMTKDGRRVEALLTGGPIIIGGSVQGLFVFAKDITHRKRNEDELEKARDELESRVQERTAELMQAIDSLHQEIAQRKIAEQQLRQTSDQLRTLATQLSIAEQRERERIAQILHNEVQQILASARFRLSEALEGADVRPVVERVGKLIEDAIEISRSLAAELCPSILAEGDLVQVMEWIANWMHEKHGMSVQIEAPGKMESPSYEITLFLFQSVRELLFNVIKHAGVKSARIGMERLKATIRVIVEDQGTGFDPSRLRAEGGEGTGLGLRSMRDRMRMTGGRLFIDSSPGRGSRFVLIVPLSDAGRNGFWKSASESDSKPRQDSSL